MAFSGMGHRARFSSRIKAIREIKGIHEHPGYWNPLESMADAFEMQAAIERDGKMKDFCSRLCVVVYGPLAKGEEFSMDPEGIVMLVNATPRQRGEAALKMLEGQA